MALWKASSAERQAMGMSNALISLTGYDEAPVASPMYFLIRAYRKNPRPWWMAFALAYSTLVVGLLGIIGAIAVLTTLGAWICTLIGLPPVIGTCIGVIVTVLALPAIALADTLRHR
jgi:hypothetical protein